MKPPQDPVEIPVGYRALPGGSTDRIQQRKVTPADGDAPPWHADTKFTVVGTDVDRVDGLNKASGRAKYAYDQNFPGLLQGMILRSPIPRGKLTRLDLDAARGLPGVGAVIALKKVGNKVRFVGDAVAAVAATTLDLARDALAAITAEYDREEHNVDWSLAEGAPQLDQDQQIVDAWSAHDGIEQALAAAKVTLDATYRTEVQTHSPLEPHGGVAKWDGDDLDVWLSTQATFGVRGQLASAMKENGIPVGNVTVHAEFVGGGFGAKFVAGIEGVAVCRLAREAKAPVKLMLDRHEEHTTTGNRPGALMQMRGGLDADGRIVAFDWRSFGGCGFTGGGGGIAYPDYYLGKAQSREPSHQDLAADTDPARPMRAPGHPQGWFGAELFFDELAHAAGIDPLTFRLDNDAETTRQDQWRFGADRFGWQRLRARQNAPGARCVRGVGLASARWGGMGSAGRPAFGITCRIHPDGSVESRSGAQDLGTGLKTVMAVLTAEELGIPPTMVKATAGHTSDPNGPASGGSTTTPSLAPAIRHAAFLASQQLRELVAQHLGVPQQEVVCKDGKVGTAARSLPWQQACKLVGPNPIEAHGTRFNNFGRGFMASVCGCQFAEVEIDTWTGLVAVKRMLGVQDCGLVIAKKLAESQVLGAMIQGVSYALHEQRRMDQRSGRMLNGDFLRYKIAGSEDLPELECHMHSIAIGHNSVGAAGLGEPPSVAAAAAIANAVFHALGIAVRHLPITPDKVLNALAKKKA